MTMPAAEIPVATERRQPRPELIPGDGPKTPQSDRSWLAGARQAAGPFFQRGPWPGEAPVRLPARRTRGHARPARDRHAADRAGRGNEDRSLDHGCGQELHLPGAVGRAHQYRRPGGRGDRAQRCPANARRDRRAAARVHRHDHPGSPAIFGDPHRRRARLQAGARGRGRGHARTRGRHRHPRAHRCQRRRGAGADRAVRMRLRQGNLYPRHRPRPWRAARLPRPCHQPAAHPASAPSRRTTW